MLNINLFPGLKYYSLFELIKRILWSGFGAILFSIIPRHFYTIRKLILILFGAKIGENTKIFPSVKITHPWLLRIGDNSIISWNVIIYNLDMLVIGNGTIISQNVHLCGGTHDYKSPGFELIRSKITIGDNVWIAADAFIGPNLFIHNNSVIGARSVVIKNVNSNCLIGGNPAKYLKEIKKPITLKNAVS
jgi:putative colanic acid biosynthesis acetyltransferase WcaF